MTELALKPFWIDYSIRLNNGSLQITATHNQRPIAVDEAPFPVRSRDPRPAECVYWVAALHVKAVQAVAAQSGHTFEALKPYCQIGVITLPDGTAIPTPGSTPNN